MRERSSFGKWVLTVVCAGFLVWGLVALQDTELGQEGLIHQIVESASRFDMDALSEFGGFREAVEGKDLIDSELERSMDVLNGL